MGWLLTYTRRNRSPPAAVLGYLWGTVNGRAACLRMSNPLQDKDAQWRHRKHGARPIFDPGAAPPGTDEEAGGASAPPVLEEKASSDPLPIEPVFQPGGPILPRWLWFSFAGVIALVMVVLAFISY